MHSPRRAPARRGNFFPLISGTFSLVLDFRSVTIYSDNETLSKES